MIAKLNPWKTIDEQHIKLDQLKQHGRRDSLRIAGLPEPDENDDIDDNSR